MDWRRRTGPIWQPIRLSSDQVLRAQPAPVGGWQRRRWCHGSRQYGKKITNQRVGTESTQSKTEPRAPREKQKQTARANRDNQSRRQSACRGQRLFPAIQRVGSHHDEEARQRYHGGACRIDRVTLAPRPRQSGERIGKANHGHQCDKAEGASDRGIADGAHTPYHCSRKRGGKRKGGQCIEEDSEGTDQNQRQRQKQGAPESGHQRPGSKAPHHLDDRKGSADARSSIVSFVNG